MKIYLFRRERTFVVSRLNDITPCYRSILKEFREMGGGEGREGVKGVGTDLGLYPFHSGIL